GDEAVLDRVRGVRRVVLDPHLPQAEPLGEPVGAQQRRETGLEPAARDLLQRQEVRVAPDRVRAGLDPPARSRRVPLGAARRVGDLERAEAALADVAGAEWVLGPTFLARERL